VTSRGLVFWLSVIFIAGWVGSQACSGGKGSGAGLDAAAPLAGAIAQDGGGVIDPGAIAKRNQCGTTTAAVDPSPCAKYQGCLADYDLTRCEWNGSHAIPSFAASAIANFFKEL
jgi:hypothetical protein